MEIRQKTRLAALVTALFPGGCPESVSSPPWKRAASAVVSPAPPRITQFYASPARPHRGEKTPVEKVWPSVRGCFEVGFEQAAIYKLSASGEPRPGPRAAPAPPDGLITVCFKARNAKNVSVGPHDEQAGCAADHPWRDTAYPVAASGAADTEVQRVTARVQ